MVKKLTIKSIYKLAWDLISAHLIHVRLHKMRIGYDLDNKSSTAAQEFANITIEICYSWKHHV